jgi:lysophospholipase L1-like esterase
MSADTRITKGVLAFGDSITNGGGELQWGVALQSWALWVARAIGLDFTNYAVDGANIDNLLALQIRGFTHFNATPDARYELGCVYIGTNDVRGLDWDAHEFAWKFDRVLRFLSERCERTLTLTLPLDLGRPRAGEKVEECTAVIEQVAAAHGTLVVDLRHLQARNLLMPDHVHLTAFGQIAVAERALATLASASPSPLPMRVRPRELIYFETTWWGRLRGDLTYLYRHVKVTLRAIGLLPQWRP